MDRKERLQQAIKNKTLSVLYIEGEFCSDLYEICHEWLKEEAKRTLVFLTEKQEKEYPQVLFSKKLEELAKHFVFLDSFYLPLHKEESDLRRLLNLYEYQAHLNMSEYADFGLLCAQNTLEHLKKGCVLIEDIKPIFLNVPAVICGAGPSLSRHLEILKGIKDKALVLSGGAGLKAVHPHLAGGIDPLTAYETSCPYFSLLRAKLQKKAQNFILPTLHPSPFEEWVWRRIGSPQKQFDIGWNVVTFLTHLACRLGCNPLIFIGVDGQKEEGYASEVKSNTSNFLPNGSKREWELGLAWQDYFFKTYPDKTFLQGQLEILEHYAPCDLSSRLSKISSFPHRKLELGSLYKDLKASLKECLSLLTHLLKSLEEQFLSKTITLDFEKLETRLFQQELFQTVVFPNWKNWETLLARQCSLEDPFEKKIHQLLFYQNVLTTYQQL